MTDNMFICMDCKTDTLAIHEYYMLNYKIWDKIHSSRTGMLCIGCAENRLGRTLQHDDFTDAPINLGIFPRSARFLNRIGLTTDLLKEEKND